MSAKTPDPRLRLTDGHVRHRTKFRRRRNEQSLVDEGELGSFARFDLLAHKDLRQGQILGVRYANATRARTHDIKSKWRVMQDLADERRELNLFFLLKVVLIERHVH